MNRYKFYIVINIITIILFFIVCVQYFIFNVHITKLVLGNALFLDLLFIMDLLLKNIENYKKNSNN